MQGSRTILRWTELHVLIIISHFKKLHIDWGLFLCMAKKSDENLYVSSQTLDLGTTF